MPNGTSERSALIEHCGVGGSVRKGTLYPISEASEAQAGAGEVMVNSREGMKEKNCKSSAAGLLLFF